jgi:hypothetical protein
MQPPYIHLLHDLGISDIFLHVVVRHSANGWWSLQILTNLTLPSHQAVAINLAKQNPCSEYANSKTMRKPDAARTDLTRQNFGTNLTTYLSIRMTLGGRCRNVRRG